MTKTHVIHVLVDGQNQTHVQNFQQLVDKFINGIGSQLRSLEFFVTSIQNRDAVRMTAIITYNEAVLP